MSPLTWILLAAGAGFLSSGLLSGLLGLARHPFVGGHTLVVSGLFAFYLFWEQVSLPVQLHRRLAAGVVVGLLFGLALARTVAGQPASPPPQGGELAVALVWDGLVYGTADALLLTVLPVLAVYGSRRPSNLASPAARWRWGGSALAASLFVTAAYHLGFREFRGAALLQPLIGNAAVTLSYLLAGNPLAPIVAHVFMHLAAVWHGMATTVQLPPHY
jgi:hypothetical protein